MAIEKQYRTFWRRFWAGGIDFIVLAPLLLVDSWVWNHATPVAVRVLWFVLHQLAVPAYSIYMHARFGQTVGKRVMRVKVIDLSGRPLTTRQAVLRELINLPLSAWGLVSGVLIVSQAGDIWNPGQADYGATLAVNLSLGLFALELVSTFASRKRRALHDLVAGSVVVRAEMLSDLNGARQEDADYIDDDVQLAAPISPTANQFACFTCGSAVNVGASHCSNCEQAFEYRNARPVAPRAGV
jgi:uncharacterized RDD family membrane protein YckC